MRTGLAQHPPAWTKLLVLSLRLTILEHILQWGHLFPTAPDTTCKPPSHPTASFLNLSLDPNRRVSLHARAP